MINISVLTPEKEVFYGSIESVKVPGVQGEFQVLQNHAPIVSALDAGRVTMVTAKGEYQYYDNESGSIKTAADVGKKISFEISGGFIEVLKNEIALLVKGVKELNGTS
jgi:F-type H+-transporting ATPase subunit epsilon